MEGAFFVAFAIKSVMPVEALKQDFEADEIANCKI
jgi:hypothetical protein